MGYKNNKYLIFFSSFAFLLLLNSCTNDENKIDLIYGEWKVEDLKSTSINENPGSLLRKEYFLEFNEGNCGIRYDNEKIETNTIKWGYQEGGEEAKFLLSIQLENTFGSSDFSLSTLYTVRKLKEDKFLLTKQSVSMSNDTTFVTNWDLNMTKD